jgi:NADH-quinone oxidoreductase subunit J
VLSIWLLSASALPRVEAAEQSDLNTVGTVLLSTGGGGYLLPFELISVLLLAAIFGAVVIAKQRSNNAGEN